MPPKPRLLPIGTVRQRLKDDWSLTVKARDGFRCLLCGGDELLTAHHWYVTAQRGHAACFCYDNGATLCFTCHIREVHENPGYATIDKVRMAVIRNSPCYNEDEIDRLTGVDYTTADLRALYAERFTDATPIAVRYDNSTPEFHVINGRISLKMRPVRRRHYLILPGKRIRIECPFASANPITATVLNVTDAKPDERLTLEPTAELKQWIIDHTN